MAGAADDIRKWAAAEELVRDGLAEMRALSDTPEDAAFVARETIKSWLRTNGSEAEDMAARESNRRGGEGMITVETYTPKRTPGAPLPVNLWHRPEYHCPDCDAVCHHKRTLKRHMKRHELERLFTAMAVR